MYQFCLDFKIRQPNIYYETGEENSGAYKTLVALTVATV